MLSDLLACDNLRSYLTVDHAASGGISRSLLHSQDIPRKEATRSETVDTSHSFDPSNMEADGSDAPIQSTHISTHKAITSLVSPVNEHHLHESQIQLLNSTDSTTSPDLPSENETLSMSIGPHSSIHTHQTTPATPGMPDQYRDLSPDVSAFDNNFVSFEDQNYPQQQYHDQFYGPFPQYANPYHPAQSFHPQPPYYSVVGSQHGQPFPTLVSSPSPFEGVPMIPEPALTVMHLLRNFNMENFADAKLQILHDEELFPAFSLYLHKMMIGRSETLFNLMNQYAGNYDEENRLHVNLRIGGRFAVPNSLEMALRSCYGESISNFNGSLFYEGHEDSGERAVAEMAESIGLAVAGHILKLQDVMLRGLEVAAIRLKWSNLEYAMSFALECCDHRKQSPDRAVIPLPSMSRSFVEHVNKPHGAAFPRNTCEFLYVCIQFISRFCPRSWAFDKSAKSMENVDRLPSVPETQPSLPGRSGLAKIQFGELLSPDGGHMKDIGSILSTVILSVPFDILKLLIGLDQGQGGPIHHQLGQIVDEREIRRKRVLDSESIDWNQRRLAKYAEWLDVGYEEKALKNSDGVEYLRRDAVTIYRSLADQKLADDRDNIGRGFRRIP